MEGLVDPAFWRGRRVLVTGHTGFKGGWLVLWLQQLGAKITGFALAPDTNPSLFELASIRKGIDHRIGDTRDMRAVHSLVDDAEPEIIYHFAAQSLVRRGYADPLQTFGTNVMGTAHLLEACRESGSVRAIVVATSDKCYEDREKARGYRETDPLGGNDPYSASKASTEHVVQAYRHAYFSSPGQPRVATVRAGNVIGGGDWSADRLLPDFFRAAAAGTPLIVRNPGATRPWQHVLEPLRGYLMVAERLDSGDADAAEAWNFGPDDDSDQTVHEVIDKVKALWPEPVETLIDKGPNPPEAGTLKVDCSKAALSLGWRPAIGLDQALRLTVDWHSRVGRDQNSARRLTCAQIESYVASATV